MNKLQKQRDIAETFSAKLRSVSGIDVRAVYWFGSRAMGRGKFDSDFDFMVETGARLTEEQRDAVADIAVDMTAQHGVLLDIHYYTSDEIKSYSYACSPFVISVLEEGEVI